MCRVASTPSMPGIRTSISTTSGCSRGHELERLASVGGLADHLEVGLGVEDEPEAHAQQLLVVDEDDRGAAHAGAACAGTAADVSRVRTRQPPPSARPGLDDAVVDRGALPHAAQSRRPRSRRAIARAPNR